MARHRTTIAHIAEAALVTLLFAGWLMLGDYPLDQVGWATTIVYVCIVLVTRVMPVVLAPVYGIMRRRGSLIPDPEDRVAVIGMLNTMVLVSSVVLNAGIAFSLAVPVLLLARLEPVVENQLFAAVTLALAGAAGLGFCMLMAYTVPVQKFGKWVVAIWNELPIQRFRLLQPQSSPRQTRRE